MLHSTDLVVLRLDALVTRQISIFARGNFVELPFRPAHNVSQQPVRPRHVTLLPGQGHRIDLRLRHAQFSGRNSSGSRHADGGSRQPHVGSRCASLRQVSVASRFVRSRKLVEELVRDERHDDVIIGALSEPTDDGGRDVRHDFDAGVVCALRLPDGNRIDANACWKERWRRVCIK